MDYAYSIAHASTQVELSCIAYLLMRDDSITQEKRHSFATLLKINRSLI